MTALLVLSLLAAEAGGPPAPPTASAAAAKPFACPAGAELRGASPPDGFEIWCEKAPGILEMEDLEYSYAGAPVGSGFR